MHPRFLSTWQTKLIAASFALLLAAPSLAKADVLLSGFNGDLSSSLGVNWEVFGPNWSAQSVPQLSEGTGALAVRHNPNWEVGLKLPAGEALAQLILANDTLEFDAIGAFGMAWRQTFAVLNGNNDHVGFSQTEEFDLSVPSEAQPFNHIVIDLNDANRVQAGAQSWKDKAQAWLNAPAGDTRTYFELLIGFQGGSNAATADFNFDQSVDGQDFLIWQRNLGNAEAGPEQGDTNFDFLVDGADLDQWEFEFGRPIVTTIDNVMFRTAAAVAAIPEPSAAMLGLLAVMATAATRRRC
jgi:hypothetical protein